MYPVSDAFLEAVQENTRNYYWTGRITTSFGQVVEFKASDILKGSGYVNRQCCGSTEMELGTVYAAEAGITLFSDIDRYTLEDAEMELFYHLRLADGSYETVPMGMFEVSEANRTVKCLELKAYDYMLRFERNFNGFETVGSAYDFMELCSKACKVELAQGRAEIEAMPNGAETLAIYSDNDIETYRDVLFYVAQVLGGFFLIDREGKLKLVKYGMEPVMEIGQKHRFSSSFSDFVTRYTAVSSTNLKTQTAEYYALEIDDGLTMNLGVNPLLQFGVKETRETLCRNILADISVIRYVPFDSETIGNPALDPGDVLRFSGGQADSGMLACITSVQCKVGGKQALKCVGKNPRLAQAKSKNDKNISGLLNQIEAGKIGIHTFTNASAFTIQDTDVKIISIQFASSEENHAQFFGQMVMDVKADAVQRSAVAKGDVIVPAVDVESIESEGGGTDAEIGGAVDGVAVDSGSGISDGAGGTNAVIGMTTEQVLSVELPVSFEEDGMAAAYFTFELNDEMVEFHHPQETWHSGKHTMLLYYPIERMIPNFTNTLNVYLRMEGGTADIEVGGCLASVSGQSMAAQEAWDGKIEIEETAVRFALAGGLRMRPFAEAVEMSTMELVQRYYSDTVNGKTKIGGFCRPVEMEG